MIAISDANLILMKLPVIQRKESTEAHVPTPWYGYYRTRTHNHVTWAVVAMDSCFTLLGAHQLGIVSTVSLAITDAAFLLPRQMHKHLFKPSNSPTMFQKKM